MKIAAVTVTYNDNQQIELFKNHYNEYAQLLAIHIIVDNGSHEMYIAQLEQSFPDSILIRRSVNGGTTAAYNDGIRYALLNGVDAILLIAQDVRLPAKSLEVLAEILSSRPKVGIIGPVLLKPDGKTISNYGGEINPGTLELSRPFVNQLLEESLPEERLVSLIAGGMNLTRRAVFEQIGLQDERLFMYGDEKDFDLRAIKAGWDILVTRTAVAIHEHPGSKSMLRPWSLFLITRNRLWLIRKHLGWKAFSLASFRALLGLPIIIWRFSRRRQFDLVWANIRGVFLGIIGQ
jgi:GT2 family glycosyltransferase